MAAPRKEAGPERTFIAFTCPDESTTASNVTAAVLAVSKYCSTVGEATARTELISLGGTNPAPREDAAAETTAPLLGRRCTAPFAPREGAAGFSGDPVASPAASARGAGEGAASVEDAVPAATGGAVPGEVVTGKVTPNEGAPAEIAPGAAAGVTPACAVTAALGRASVVFGGAELMPGAA